MSKIKNLFDMDNKCKKKLKINGIVILDESVRSLSDMEKVMDDFKDNLGRSDNKTLKIKHDNH